MSQSGIDHAKGQINSATQPNAKFWCHMHKPHACSMELNMHQGETRDGYYNLLFMNHPGQTTASGWVGANDIDALWIPPNWQMTADACGNTNHCRSGQTLAYYDGAGGNAGFPGVYWPIQDGIGPNNIDTILLTQKQDKDETDINDTKTVPYTWDRFKLKCCAGAIDANNCGIYAPNKPGSVCNDIVGTCLGSDLKSPYGSKPSYKTQYCSDYATKNDSVGDLIKRTWCNDNPDDSWCSCMNLTKTPEYLRWQKLMTERYPEIPVSVLMYGGKDGTNPCRDNMDYDMSEIFIPSGVLASKGQLPRSYNISTLEVTGNNNVLSNVNMSQNVTNNAPAEAAAAASGGKSVLSSITKRAEAIGSKYGLSAKTVNMLLIIIVAVVFGTAGYYMFMKENEPPMDYQTMGYQTMGYQPMGYQPMGYAPQQNR